MDENQLITQLTRSWKGSSSVIQGVGDDCAVIKGDSPKHFYLLKTDAVVENRHFTSTTAPRLIGRKALARVLSDFAAMGGCPLYALVTLGLPKKFSTLRLKQIYSGLTQFAITKKVNLVGGETTRTKELLLSVSAMGETKGYRPVLRSTARPNDLIFVTGRLGRSLTTGHHLKFIPRLKEGQWLAETGLATSMMDLSDGLGTDLPRLAKASGTGFHLDYNLLPCARGASWKEACADGEDYELLFTAAPAKIDALQKIWPFKTKLTLIGKMTKPGSVSSTERKLPHGFDHLRNSRRN